MHLIQTKTIQNKCKSSWRNTITKRSP